jgi:hypothetical protein
MTRVLTFQRVRRPDPRNGKVFATAITRKERGGELVADGYAVMFWYHDDDASMLPGFETLAEAETEARRAAHANNMVLGESVPFEAPDL